MKVEYMTRGIMTLLVSHVNHRGHMLWHLHPLLPWWCGWGCECSPASCSSTVSWRPSPPGAQCLCGPSQPATPPPAPTGTALLDFSHSAHPSAHCHLFHYPIRPVSERGTGKGKGYFHQWILRAVRKMIEVKVHFLSLIIKYDLPWRPFVCGKTAGEGRGKQDVSLTFSHLHAPGTVGPAGTLHSQNAGSAGTQMPSRSQALTPSAQVSQHHPPQLQFPPRPLA